MIRARLAAVAAVATLAGCTFLDPLPGERTNVEAVLRATEYIAVMLDREEREALKSRGRSVTALPPLTFQPPLERIALNSRFGARDGRTHTGLDLQAAEGTPIRVALDGFVVFAGDSISGYGLTVIVRHLRGMSTLYAHASELLVDEGARVETGQKIALVGETGNASGPHLHFELREGLKAVDPEPLVRSPSQSRK